MARKVDKQTVVDNFWELAELVDDNSKVILTSRTELFRWAGEAETILGGEELGRRMPALKPPKCDVLYLEPFSDEQIRAVIKGRVSEGRGDVIADEIMAEPNLREMARKPVLAELLLAALDEIEAKLLTNQAEVYLHATNKLLLRNIDTKRTFTSTTDKLFFLCELAWQMIESGVLRIHYKDIPERIKSHFSEEIRGSHDLDHWDYDLRNQTLLCSDKSGYYEFAHKSLAEYFVAFKFAAELGCLSPPFSDTYREEHNKPSSPRHDRKPVAELPRTFGASPICSRAMTAVRRFLTQMITIQHSQQHTQALSTILQSTRDLKTPVHYLAGNLATLLSEEGELPQAGKLDGIDLSGAALRWSMVHASFSEDAVSGTHLTLWFDTDEVPGQSEVSRWLRPEVCVGQARRVHDKWLLLDFQRGDLVYDYPAYRRCLAEALPHWDSPGFLPNLWG